MPRRTERTIIAPQNKASDPASDVIMSGRQDIKSLFMGMALPKLKAGQYPVQLLSSTLVEDPDPKKSHVRLSWKFSDRIVTDNRFVAGFQVFTSQLLQQLGIEQAVPVQELLGELAARGTFLDCWVSYNTSATNGQEYRNYNFLPPLVLTSAEAGEDDNF